MDALLRRFQQARLELRVELRVDLALGDLELEHEAARLDRGAEILEARLLPACLPARHLGPIASQTLRELRLREAGLHPGRPDDLRARHGDQLYSCVD